MVHFADSINIRCNDEMSFLHDWHADQIHWESMAEQPLFSSWWQFKYFLCSSRKLGKISNLTNMFQMGWFNYQLDMGVSKNRGIPKSSIFIGFSIINHSWDHLGGFYEWKMLRLALPVWAKPPVVLAWAMARWTDRPIWREDDGVFFLKPLYTHMGVSENRGKPPKWMVYNGKSY